MAKVVGMSKMESLMNAHHNLHMVEMEEANQKLVPSDLGLLLVFYTNHPTHLSLRGTSEQDKSSSAHGVVSGSINLTLR